MWLDCGNTADPFDIVHATAFPYGFPIACGLRLARRRNIPFVLTPFLHIGDSKSHEDPVRRAYTASGLRSLALAADFVFAQTEAEKEVLCALGVESRRIRVQGMGVDPLECTGGNRRQMRELLGIAEQTVVIGHLANNSREKGTTDLLHAANALWGRGKRFHLVLAGPEMPNFTSFWQRFSPAGPVTRLGVLSEEQKRDYFALIDVFVLPSRSDSFGLVLLESWANGKPNIAYRAGGPGEIIRDEEDGLLAPCGDIDALTRSIGRMVDDPGTRTRLGERGRSRVGREFRWDDKLGLVRKCYEELVADLANESIMRINPKSEIRNPKEISIPKSQKTKRRIV
jgi:glycosyltransferase involved in cell wall biosynthesis